MHALARALTQRFNSLATAEASPQRLGVAVGVGVFFACTPFYGLQLVMALAVAVPLRLNKLAVALGTQLSIPPLIPFIVIASANLGELILHRRLVSLSFTEFRALSPQQIAARVGFAWTVGGMVLGLMLGLSIGTGVALVAARRTARQP